jgi:hypothetical protein
MSAKRNIVIEYNLWSAIHSAIGKETPVTGEPLTAVGYIRRAPTREFTKAGIPVKTEDEN